MGNLHLPVTLQVVIYGMRLHEGARVHLRSLQAAWPNITGREAAIPWAA